MKLSTVIFSIIIILALVSIPYGAYQAEQSRRAEIGVESTTANEYAEEIFSSKKPSLEGRSFYGNESADITLVVYSNPLSVSGKAFQNTTLPLILNNYVHTGQVKLYHKYHLTNEDFTSQNENFIYAKTLECINKGYSEKYYSVLFKGEAVPPCNATNIELSSLILEVENFGMAAVEPRIYLGINGGDYTIIEGIPSTDRLNALIRDYQTRLGY